MENLTLKEKLYNWIKWFKLNEEVDINGIS